MSSEKGPRCVRQTISGETEITSNQSEYAETTESRLNFPVWAVVAGRVALLSAVVGIGAVGCSSSEKATPEATHATASSSPSSIETSQSAAATETASTGDIESYRASLKVTSVGDKPIANDENMGKISTQLDFTPVITNDPRLLDTEAGVKSAYDLLLPKLTQLANAANVNQDNPQIVKVIGDAWASVYSRSTNQPGESTIADQITQSATSKFIQNHQYVMVASPNYGTGTELDKISAVTQQSSGVRSTSFDLAICLVGLDKITPAQENANLPIGVDSDTILDNNVSLSLVPTEKGDSYEIQISDPSIQ